MVGVLRDPGFQAGEFDTSYLARAELDLLLSPRNEAIAVVHPLAAALAAQWERRTTAPVLQSIPSGWRNVPNSLQQVVFIVNDERVCVRYGFNRTSPAGVRVLTAVIGEREIARIVARHLSERLVDLEVEGVRRQVDVHRVGDLVFVDSALGSNVLREESRFPAPEDSQIAGSLLAPMPGTVVRAEVVVGDKVVKGAAVVVLEAMKMEHVIGHPPMGS